MAANLAPHRSLGITMMNGFPFPDHYSIEYISKATDFLPRDTDIIIVNYPHCSSSWVYHCLWKLGGLKLLNPKCRVLLDSLVPRLETSDITILHNVDGTRVIRTGLPYRLQNINPNTKYIYITRHPRDVLISYYNFARNNITGGITHENFFVDFNRGQVPYGDYFKHVLEWYDKRNANIYFLSYESMHVNPSRIISMIARFLSPAHSEACGSESAIDQFLQFPGYDYRHFTVDRNSVAELFSKQHSIGEVAFLSPGTESPFHYSSYIGVSKFRLTTYERSFMESRINTEFANGKCKLFAVDHVSQMAYI